MNLIEYTPGPEEWAHRFGGYPARLSIKPGDVLRVAIACVGLVVAVVLAVRAF